MCVAVDFISTMVSHLRGDDEDSVSSAKEKCLKGLDFAPCQNFSMWTVFDLVYMPLGNQLVLGILVTQTLCLDYFQIH